MPLELCCFNYESVEKAYSAMERPDRIELCSHAEVGGLSPDMPSFHGLKTQLQERYSEDQIPINVMIRQLEFRESSFGVNGSLLDGVQNFIHLHSEYAIMEKEVEAFVEAGADGLVFGGLVVEAALERVANGENGTVDEEEPRPRPEVHHCQRLIAAAKGRPCTFHRAFDQIDPRDMEEALDLLAYLGFDAVLTSGGKGNAVDNIEVLRKLVGWSKNSNGGERMKIIVGGGVRSDNVQLLQRETGAQWFHSSAIVDDGVTASEEEIQKLKQRL